MCSPRSGGAVRIEPGVRGELEREPTWRMRAERGVLELDGHAARLRLRRGERRDDVVDRAGRDLGRVERRQPVGGRALAKRAARSGPEHVAVRDAVAVRRRTADRRRGRGSPSASQNRGHCRSLPTATAIAPSAVSNVSYGTMFGWALPRRPGASPVTNAFWAWLTRTARVEPSSETSIRWPRDRAVRGVALARRAARRGRRPRRTARSRRR